MRETFESSFLLRQTRPECIHVAPARLSLQAERSIAGNLGSSQSERQQRERSSVVDDVPSERALSGLWIINSPFKSILKARPAALFVCVLIKGVESSKNLQI